MPHEICESDAISCAESHTGVVFTAAKEERKVKSEYGIPILIFPIATRLFLLKKYSAHIQLSENFNATF